MLGTKRLVELCHRMKSLDVSGFNCSFYRSNIKPLYITFDFHLHNHIYTHTKIQALIHVSTAYCNCDRTEISEVVYTTPYHPDDIISLINWLPEDMLDKVSAP